MLPCGTPFSALLLFFKILLIRDCHLREGGLAQMVERSLITSEVPESNLRVSKTFLSFQSFILLWFCLFDYYFLKLYYQFFILYYTISHHSSIVDDKH